MIKLLLTIPLALTPLFCYSCNNKDICYSCNNKDIGKEVGSRINEENQKLIEELNEIIIKQRKEIEQAGRSAIRREKENGGEGV